MPPEQSAQGSLCSPFCRNDYKEVSSASQANGNRASPNKPRMLRPPIRYVPSNDGVLVQPLLPRGNPPFAMHPQSLLGGWLRARTPKYVQWGANFDYAVLGH